MEPTPGGSRVQITGGFFGSDRSAPQTRESRMPSSSFQLVGKMRTKGSTVTGILMSPLTTMTVEPGLTALTMPLSVTVTMFGDSETIVVFVDWFRSAVGAVGIVSGHLQPAFDHPHLCLSFVGECRQVDRGSSGRSMSIRIVSESTLSPPATAADAVSMYFPGVMSRAM